jgi:hypothetical protein
VRGAADTAQTTDQTVNEANLKAQVQQIVDMLAAGGNVVTGTDSPIDHTAVSTHMNLRAMVRYGVSAHQAMVTATSASGIHLNEPIGQVAPGMFADLAMLGGNPLEDITEAADVKQVMVNGYLHDIADLTAPFAGAAPPATKAETVENRVLAPKPLLASERRYWWHHPHYLEEGKRSCCAGG